MNFKSQFVAFVIPVQRRSIMTFSDFAQVFTSHIHRHLKPPTIRLYELALNKTLLPAFGEMPLTEIKRSDVMRLHRELHDRPVLANRVIAVGRSLFSYAWIHDVVSDSCNPFRRIPFYKEKRRDRILNKAEYCRLGRALDHVEHNGAAPLHGIAAIRVLLLTGCRVSEIECLRWDEVDFDAKTLRLPDSKTGPRLIEMPRAVRTILVNLPARQTEYVFPGRGGRITLRWAWEIVRSQAGLNDLRLHDLRHSYATIAVNNGVPIPVLAKLLGHSTVWTTTRYLHASRSDSAKAAELVTSKIMRAVNPKVPDVALKQPV